MSEVSEERIKSLMHEFIKAQQEGDVERTLSFFAEDASYVTPMGTFHGEKELRAYFAHTAETIPDLTITPTGIDAIAEGGHGATST